MARRSRITFQGVNLFGNDYQFQRVTAFGTTGTFNDEDIFELGNTGIAGYADDIETVDITMDARVSSLNNLAIWAGKDPTTATYVDLRDLEYSSVDLYTHIKPVGEDEIVMAKYIERAFLTSYTVNFTVDGDATESFAASADNKQWLLNNGRNVVATTVDAEPGTSLSVPFASVTTIAKVLAVFKDGERLELVSGAPGAGQVAATVNGNSVELMFGDALVGTEKIKVRVAADAGGKLYVPPTDVPAAVRRGQIEVYLLDNVVHDGGNVISADEVLLPFARTVNIDAAIAREDITALHTAQFVDRPVQFPNTVNISLEINHDDMVTFFKLAGLNAASDVSASLRGWRRNLGLRIKVYDKRDVDPGVRKQILEWDIPYMLPNDEGWSGDTGTNFTQTFSFRSHELRVKKIA